MIHRPHSVAKVTCSPMGLDREAKMARRTRKGMVGRAKLPPAEIVHSGSPGVETTEITIMEYDEAHFQEVRKQNVDVCFRCREHPPVVWISIEGLHEAETITGLGEGFELHPLVLEDVLSANQRPKMDDLEDYLFIVLRMPYLDKNSGVVEHQQISLVLGATFVLSFQEADEDVFAPIRERIRSAKGRIRRLGADYLAYALIDTVVDSYFVVLEGLEDRLDLLEEELVANARPETLHMIHDLKREMIFLLKSVWPMREVVGRLTRGESSLVRDSTEVYFRDVYDHAFQVMDTVETFREMLSGMLEMYLSSISNRMNEIMKVLTIIATLFIPLTFITGVYGMNFKHMPELEWRWGYLLVWVVMFVVAALMLLYFRRKKWL